MNAEAPQRGATENSAEGSVINSTISAVLSGEKQPHELMEVSWLAWCLWSDGFRAGFSRSGDKIARLEREADVYYDLAFNGDAAHKRQAETLRHFDVVQARRAADARLRAEEVAR